MSKQIRPKTLLTALAAVIVIVVGGMWYDRSTNLSQDTTSKQIIVDTVDRGMSPEQRDTFYKKIAELQVQIADDANEGKRDISKILQLGNMFYTAGELAQANEQYKDILRTNPTDTPAMENMGQSLMEMGDYEGAAALWVRSLNISANEQIYIKLVDLITERLPAKNARIQEILESAIANIGQTPTLLKRLAQWYGENGKYEEAISHYEVAQKLNLKDTSIKEEIDALRLKQAQALRLQER